MLSESVSAWELFLVSMSMGPPALAQDRGMHRERAGHVPVSAVVWRCAGNQNFPNPGNDDVELASSLIFNEATNMIEATGSLPLTDTNSFNNVLAVLFRE